MPDKEVVLRASEYAEAYRVACVLAPIYVTHQWRWATTGVPNRDQIRAEIERMMEICYKGRWSSSNTGGLYVAWSPQAPEDDDGSECRYVIAWQP